MAARMDMVFIGIKGAVLALDRATGVERWRTGIKGSDFVNVVVQDGDLYAATKGELCRLDPATGTILWQNELKGLGRGLMTIAGGSQVAPARERQEQDEHAAAAAAVVASS